MFGRGKGQGITIRRVLVVENEPLLAFDAEHLLTESGFEVVATVDTVADADRALATGGVDLVLLDVRLNGGSGIDVAQAAKAAGVPVLFVAGACPPQAPELAVGCLAKPYGQRDLLAAIAAVAAKLGGAKPGRLPRGLTLF